MMRTIGAISDTHGLLRPQALAALAGCDRIIHAGDIGSPDVLARLGALAPVHAVRGNVDHASCRPPSARKTRVCRRKASPDKRMRGMASTGCSCGQRRREIFIEVWRPR